MRTCTMASMQRYGSYTTKSKLRPCRTTVSSLRISEAPPLSLTSSATPSALV